MLKIIKFVTASPWNLMDDYLNKNKKIITSNIAIATVLLKVTATKEAKM